MMRGEQCSGLEVESIKSGEWNDEAVTLTIIYTCKVFISHAWRSLSMHLNQKYASVWFGCILIQKAAALPAEGSSALVLFLHTAPVEGCQLFFLWKLLLISVHVCWLSNTLLISQKSESLTGFHHVLQACSLDRWLTDHFWMSLHLHYIWLD